MLELYLMPDLEPRHSSMVGPVPGSLQLGQLRSGLKAQVDCFPACCLYWTAVLLVVCQVWILGTNILWMPDYVTVLLSVVCFLRKIFIFHYIEIFLFLFSLNHEMLTLSLSGQDSLLINNWQIENKQIFRF